MTALPRTDGLTVEPRSASPDGVVVLEVAGDLVVSNLSLLESVVDEALDAGALRVVLDLGDLGHVDTPGLALLYRLQRRCEGAGGGLAVAGLPERFSELTRKLLLDEHVPFVRSVEEARARLAP